MKHDRHSNERMRIRRTERRAAISRKLAYLEG